MPLAMPSILLSRSVLALAVGAAACGTVTAFEPSVDAAAVAFACTVVVDDTGATIERGRPCGAGTTGASTYGAALPGATLLRLTVEAIDDAGNRAAAIERLFCRGTTATCLPR